MTGRGDILAHVDYNSRPSTRGIISMIAGASPMELLQFSPLCEGHPHLVQRTHRAAVITTPAPLRGASEPVLIHLRSLYITTRTPP